jgi:hypothetical protein
MKRGNARGVSAPAGLREDETTMEDRSSRHMRTLVTLKTNPDHGDEPWTTRLARLDGEEPKRWTDHFAYWLILA